MPTSIEQRVAALERQLAALQQHHASAEQDNRAWLDDLYGKFANDPIFAKAMKLGAEYRKSLRPREVKGKSKR